MLQITVAGEEAGRLLGQSGRQTAEVPRPGLFERLVAEGRLGSRRLPCSSRPRRRCRAPSRATVSAACCSGSRSATLWGTPRSRSWPGLRRCCVGEIRSYLPNRRAWGRRVGLPSDDTQLAFWTVEQLVEDGQLDVDELVRRFGTRPVFGMGRSVHCFRRNIAAGLAWPEAAPRSAGNGALMRIAPVLLPHLSRPSRTSGSTPRSPPRSHTTTPPRSPPA